MALEMSSSNRGRRQRFAPKAEINITPLVDVMLVLLIIFMVTAPLMTLGVQVDLPKTKAGALNESTEPLTVTLNKNGEIYIQETKVDPDGLIPRLNAITGSNPDNRIFVRGDKSISYGQVMEVMGAINGAGFTKVALISESPQGSAGKKK